jgi:Protein of unknown function (DUF1638)
MRSVSSASGLRRAVPHVGGSAREGAGAGSAEWTRRDLPTPLSDLRASFPSDRSLRLRAVACEVLARSVYLCAARSPHIVDVSLLRRALHDDPLDLRTQLQREIDVTGPEYDAIVLAYGLCGGAAAGLIAREVPIVLPRAHDCITVFLGSRGRYREEFIGHPGTFWYVLDYVERNGGGGPLLTLGSGLDEDLETVRAQFVEKYGEENADYLMEELGAWQSHYDRAAWIDMGVRESPQGEARAQAQADRRGWTFDRLAGDLDLVRRLVDGEWADDFLVLRPGERLAMAYDEGVVRAESVEFE